MMHDDKFQSLQSSTEWQQQILLLQSLQITPQTAQTLTTPKTSTTIKNLLLNPRSKVLISTCQFLTSICQKYGPIVAPFAANLISTDILWKLLNSSNRVVFMEVHQLCKAIVMYCPTGKFYRVFGAEMVGRSCQVRECVSAYLSVLVDSVDPPANFYAMVRNWKNDPSKIVRQNMLKIQQTLSKHPQKPPPQKPNKQNLPPPQLKKPTPVPQTSQIILQSFLNPHSSHPSSSHPSPHVDTPQTIQFLLSKIYSNDNWNMKMYALEQLYQVFENNVLEEKDWMKVMGVFVDFLDQRRSKVNVIMCGIFKKCVQDDGELVRRYLGDGGFQGFVDKAGKSEEYGKEIIGLVVDLDPIKYVLQLAQWTIDVKSMKEKVLVLDLLASKFTEIQIPVGKTSIFVKLMGRHIQKHSSNKQIYLPCLAILSHLKTLHPSQFLSCLLTQQKQTLTKILQLSQRIDPNLREAIITYIHELKGPSEKSHMREKEVSDSCVVSLRLRELLDEVCDEGERGDGGDGGDGDGEEGGDSVRKLVEYVFEGKVNISVREFYEIIRLTEKVTSKDSLLQLELLLEEICKTQNQNFVEALFQAVASCNGNSIEGEYILAYLRKIHSSFSNFSWLMHPRHAQKLISTYRYSKCPKIRLLCIKILSLFPAQLSAAYTSPKQKKLIQTQQKPHSPIIHPDTSLT